MSTNSETTCSICTDPFDDPRMLLECMHTFCRQCLHDLFSSSSERGSDPRRKLRCPVCRRDYELTDDDIDQLPARQLPVAPADAHEPQPNHSPNSIAIDLQPVAEQIAAEVVNIIDALPNDIYIDLDTSMAVELSIETELQDARRRDTEQQQQQQPMRRDVVQQPGMSNEERDLMFAIQVAEQLERQNIQQPTHVPPNNTRSHVNPGFNTEELDLAIALELHGEELQHLANAAPVAQLNAYNRNNHVIFETDSLPSMNFSLDDDGCWSKFRTSLWGCCCLWHCCCC